MIISLTGFMGIGKSTISEQLSKQLYCKSIDLDKYIEFNEGLSVDEIFRSKGEPYFRKKEEYYLNKLLTENREKVLVVSMGGGTLMSRLNQELIKKKTFCIYLKASPGTQLDRLSKSQKARPNIEGLSADEFEKGIKSLFEVRREGYEYSSSLIIDVDSKSIKDILTEIINSI